MITKNYESFSHMWLVAPVLDTGESRVSSSLKNKASSCTARELYDITHTKQNDKNQGSYVEDTNLVDVADVDGREDNF